MSLGTILCKKNASGHDRLDHKHRVVRGGANSVMRDDAKNKVNKQQEGFRETHMRAVVTLRCLCCGDTPMPAAVMVSYWLGGLLLPACGASPSFL